MRSIVRQMVSLCRDVRRMATNVKSQEDHLHWLGMFSILGLKPHKFRQPWQAHMFNVFDGIPIAELELATEPNI